MVLDKNFQEIGLGYTVKWRDGTRRGIVVGLRFARFSDAWDDVRVVVRPTPRTQRGPCTQSLAAKSVWIVYP